MDGRSFDRLARLLSAAGSRRQALRALLTAIVIGAASTAAEARERKPSGRHNRNRRRDRSRKLHAEALPAHCCSSVACAPGPGKNLAKCCYEAQNLTGKNFKGANLGSANFRGATLINANFAGANLGKACLVEANLTGATINRSTNLSGTIFCHTIMPDGSANNSGCTASTKCCPTCRAVGAECSAGAGTSCCGGATCSNGRCACAAETPTDCNGICVSLQTDRANCGSCGNRCTANETCFGGQCACEQGNVICRDMCVQGGCCNGGSGVGCADGESCCSPDGCKDLANDPNNCGACGIPCNPTTSSRCVGGSCFCGDEPACVGGQECVDNGCRCPQSQELCDGECREIAQPGQGCGDCGTSCPKGESCTAGACSCGSSGTCPASQSCVDGACTCGEGRVFCADDCVVCPAPPPGVGLPGSNEGFCCDKTFCSCDRQCCKDDCFWTVDSSNNVVDEFCCTASGGVVCNDQCCRNSDCLNNACVRMNPVGGNIRRPGR